MVNYRYPGRERFKPSGQPCGASEILAVYPSPVRATQPVLE